mgnify:CR=1 FL=1
MHTLHAHPHTAIYRVACIVARVLYHVLSDYASFKLDWYKCRGFGDIRGTTSVTWPKSCRGISIISIIIITTLTRRILLPATKQARNCVMAIQNPKPTKGPGAYSLVSDGCAEKEKQRWATCRVVGCEHAFVAASLRSRVDYLSRTSAPTTLFPICSSARFCWNRENEALS